MEKYNGHITSSTFLCNYDWNFFYSNKHLVTPKKYAEMHAGPHVKCQLLMAVLNKTEPHS